MKEAQIYELLSKYNINTPYFKLFKIDEKLHFDKFPCVLKIHSTKVSHKTDVGGVIVGIQNNRQLNSAKKTIIKKAKVNLNKIKTVPYKNNYGYMFTSGPNTWHGMEKKTIVKERRCIQVNYVTFETDWKVNS